MLAEEAERILLEREKNSEMFFKEESEEVECKDSLHDNEKNESEATDSKEIEQNEMEKPSLNENYDSDVKDQVDNETTCFDEMSRALLLEEGSSDENENEKDLENMFLPSKKDVNNAKNVDQAGKANEDINEILHVNSPVETTPRDLNLYKSSNASNEASKKLISSVVNDSLKENSNGVEKSELESESLRLFLEPDDDPTEKVANMHVKNRESEMVEPDLMELSIEKMDKQSPKTKEDSSKSNVTKTILQKSENKLNLTALEQTLANIGPPKLGRKSIGLSNNDSSDFLVFEVEKDDYSKEDKGLTKLKDRFVKHVKCEKFNKFQEHSNSKPVEMTIVRKEIDSEGNA